jgi:hypothetical protein
LAVKKYAIQSAIATQFRPDGKEKKGRRRGLTSLWTEMPLPKLVVPGSLFGYIEIRIMPGEDGIGERDDVQNGG